MSYDDNEAEILSGGGGVRKPKVMVPPVGGVVQGIIVGAWKAQAREWNQLLGRGDKPKYYTSDGKGTTTTPTDNPVIDHFIVVQAFEPDGDDDGRRSIGVSNKYNVREERKRINSEFGGMAIGGHLALSRPEDDRPNTPGGRPAHQLRLTYIPPDQVILKGDALKPSVAPKSTATDENPFA